MFKWNSKILKLRKNHLIGMFFLVFTFITFMPMHSLENRDSFTFFPHNLVSTFQKHITVETDSHSQIKSPLLLSISNAHRDMYFRKTYDLNLGSIGNKYNIFTLQKNFDIISNEKAKEVAGSYLNQMEIYEYNKNWGLMKNYEEKARYSEIKNFGNQFGRVILDYQIQSNMQKAEKGSEEIRAIRTIQKKVEGIIQGGTAEMAVNEDTKFGTRANIPDRTGGLFMNSKLLNLSFDANFSGNPMADRYFLSASRNIPIINVQSNFVYGAESTILNASISRPIVKNVSAQFSHLRGLDKNKSQLNGQTSDTVQVNYGISF